MDHTRLLNQIRSRPNLHMAFRFAFQDRIHTDYYFDYFEMEYVHRNREIILDEIETELQTPATYIPRPAYAFYPPKTDLCYRRMIYIAFKDLVIRYAIVLILANHLESELSPLAFANRRAKDEEANHSLLQDFARESWPAFCTWQKEETTKNSVLLKTDISAFYDSVSHDYLVSLVARELSISEDAEVIQLFRKVLCVPVISYSQLTHAPRPPEEVRQGLAIGNNTDGFLANIYLKDIDSIIDGIPEIEFGRYNDDMRIFGNSRAQVLKAVLALQELLLTKGLNLNSGKTRIAENEYEIEELRSKYYEVYSYVIIEEEVPEISVTEINRLESEIDKPFDDFERQFEADQQLNENKDAKDYCKYISNNKLLPRNQRTPVHVNNLENILINWQGSGKHASWLIVQSAFWNDIPSATQEAAKEAIFNCLINSEVDYYSKYRLLHHLVRLRGGTTSRFRYIDRLSDQEKESLRTLMPNLLREAAFELNIIGLYTLKVLGATGNELKEYVNQYIPKPVGEPIKNALSYIAEPVLLSDDELDIAIEEEPDIFPQPY